MAEYSATVEWERAGAKFVDNRYSRGHAWEFDGGVRVPASSSPHVVPLPYSIPAAVDPEEAFVASLSSCHMLWFLSIAAKRGFTVDQYRDAAVGTMGRNAAGKEVMLEVRLRPAVTFAGERIPSSDEHAALHHDAHEECYIANSVTTTVRCEPQLHSAV
jgi:organic hydroperoxide reductase OsmC/OhrA